MRRIALLLPLLIAACNWSDLEAELLAAAPEGKDLSLTPPTGQRSQSLESGELGTREDALERTKVYDNVVSTASGVNDLVSALCGGLDAIRSSRIPASKREEDALTWGPFDDDKHPGLQAQVVLRRTADGYAYELQWGRKGEPDSLVKVIVGQFYGEQAREGYGSFVLDAGQARAIRVADPRSPDDMRGIDRVVLDYDMRSGASKASLRFEASSGDSSAIDYEVEPEGGGWMEYRWVADFVPRLTGERETLLVDAKWLADKAGFATARVSGGDLPPGVEGFSAECWNQDLMQAFWERNFDCPPGQLRCGEATRDQCVLAPPQQ